MKDELELAKPQEQPVGASHVRSVGHHGHVKVLEHAGRHQAAFADAEFFGRATHHANAGDVAGQDLDQGRGGQQARRARQVVAAGVTDLGERIVQLGQELPSHIVVPAVHRSRAEIGELFHVHMQTPSGESDPVRLTEYARRDLRPRFLAAEAGIDADGLVDNSASYIQSWLKALRNDKKLVVFAGAQAQKAVDHILGRSSECEAAA